MLVSCITKFAFTNVQPPCCLSSLSGSFAAGTNTYTHTPIPVAGQQAASQLLVLLDDMSFVSWSIYSHLHLPLHALQGRRTSTAGEMLLDPCRVLPQVEQKAKEEIAHQMFIPHFPLGARAELSKLIWYCGLRWLCRVSRVIAVHSYMLQHCAEGA